ncbi:Tpr-related protein family member, putative [Theileria annulata]|uniref:Tpr-related protein family member, putative n=1 Tax=Theileria annulata TaxID=5874 RepID=Q4UI33_THEAN|nr:Tpr-related protein family member, putative [Theileria annulata]CAI73256.1 Tpr-related protein family member, putative [Theileria annulata]|eukprot:XP_953933.1 Tpr-related protein family member, putative [Theileria annulata]
MAKCPSCTGPAGIGQDSCGLLIAAYVLAGLAMMLNIRLSYSSAPYALIRFRLPENLFSVFVRRMASALELWCLPSMLLGNIMDLFQKGCYNNVVLPIAVQVLKSKASGLSGLAGTLSTKAGVLHGVLGSAEVDAKAKATALQQAASKPNDPKGLEQLLDELSGINGDAQKVLAKYKEVVDAYNDVASDAEAKKKDSQLQAVTSAFNALHMIKTLDKFHLITVPSIICQWLNFLTYVLLLVVYLMGGDQGHLTVFYFVIAISGVVFGINMTLVYSADWNYTPVYIVGENCFPIITSFIHYLATLLFGNRRKWNSDFLIVNIDIWVAIIISFVAAVVWTIAYGHCDSGNTDGTTVEYGHIFAEGFDTDSKVWCEIISPTLMVIVGMGLVYSIYPGIAPGMIVPFYLVDKIEMVLLIATFFPPVIVALLQRFPSTKKYSPKATYVYPDGMGGWRPYQSDGTVHNWFWHLFDILIVIKILLAAIFIYSLHYRDSAISRSIINQPKMSTALSIIFYMCHEILLALGFAGVIGNNGGTYVLLPAQYVGALFMIFLAFYSEGYIIEYKSHDPGHWPTEGMTKWNEICYWYYFKIISLGGWYSPHGFYYDKV